MPVWEEQHRPMVEELHAPGKSPPNQVVLPANVVHFRFHLHAIEEYSRIVHDLEANKIPHGVQPRASELGMVLGIHGDRGYVAVRRADVVAPLDVRRRRIDLPAMFKENTKNMKYLHLVNYFILYIC